MHTVHTVLFAFMCSDVLFDGRRACFSRVGCGIIARSSGLFENNKRICACDGVTIWDEKKVPAAGAKRSEFVNQQANPAASSHL